MAAEVEIARREWEDGYRRLYAGDAPARPGVYAQVEAIMEELRRRVGSMYTTAELAGAYGDAERWAREAVAQAGAGPGWERTLVVATEAAFHAYARGAVDYEP